MWAGGKPFVLLSARIESQRDQGGGAGVDIDGFVDFVDGFGDGFGAGAGAGLVAAGAEESGSFVAGSAAVVVSACVCTLGAAATPLPPVPPSGRP